MSLILSTLYCVKLGKIIFPLASYVINNDVKPVFYCFLMFKFLKAYSDGLNIFFLVLLVFMLKFFD